MTAHHKVFNNFKCWQGELKTGYVNDFLGIMTKTEYYPLEIPPMKSYPPFNEEYFEWVDLLEAVTSAKASFTMYELGAGWGRWLCRGGVALKQYNSKMPYQLIGVEAEPTHWEWMSEHLAENGIDLSHCKLIWAAVAKKDGKCNFIVGNPAWCYGQHIVIQGSEDGGETTRLTYLKKRMKYLSGVGFNHLTHFNIKPIIRYCYNLSKPQERQGEIIKAISLQTLLENNHIVDLIDCDIQGSEYDVFSTLSKSDFGKIKRVHIGTHSVDVEDRLRKLFSGLGWHNNYDFSIGQTYNTEYGEIKFGDGVQSWSRG